MPVAPAVHAAPCYLCPDDGLAYLTAPQTLALTMPSTTDLPDGCECPGCVEARALLATVTNTDETSGIAPEDGVNYLAMCQINSTERNPDPWGASTQRTTTVGLCPEHTAQVFAALNAADGTCAWCGAMFSTAMTDLGLGLDGRTITQVNFAQRGSMLRNVAPRFRNARALREQSTEATEIICTTCFDTSVVCGDCNTDVRDGYQYYCEECETDVCRGCWDGTHYRHAERNRDEYGSDRARYNFAPRQTIAGALELVGAPGSTILSTRALGIEIETARGNAQIVIDRERSSAIPVLQAVGTDGSVRGRNPVEYRLLPARGAFAEYALRSMTTWCREADYQPDSSAGIHMHVDCSAHSPEQVWRAFAALVILEPVLFSHAANHRLNSQYCQGYGVDSPRIVDAALAAAGRMPTYFEPDEISVGSRYRSINCHAFSGHRTLEVRVFDAAHDDEALQRLTDAAAIIAGAVDFAVSSAWHDFIAAPRTDRSATVMRLLGAMAVEGHITSDTVTRAMARLDARTLVAA